MRYVGTREVEAYSRTSCVYGPNGERRGQMPVLKPGQEVTIYREDVPPVRGKGMRAVVDFVNQYGEKDRAMVLPSEVRK